MKNCLLNTRIEILHGVDVVLMVPSLVCTRRYVCNYSLMLSMLCEIFSRLVVCM